MPRRRHISGSTRGLARKLQPLKVTAAKSRPRCLEYVRRVLNFEGFESGGLIPEANFSRAVKSHRRLLGKYVFFSSLQRACYEGNVDGGYRVSRVDAAPAG